MFHSNRQHLENQTGAQKLRCGLQDKAFLKNRNGTLGGHEFYSGHMAVIKGSGF
jgi:hypothetical protein